MLLVVTDKRGNIVKAICLLWDQKEQVQDPADSQAQPDWMDMEADDTDNDLLDTEAEENGLGKEVYIANKLA